MLQRYSHLTACLLHNIFLPVLDSWTTMHIVCVCCLSFDSLYCTDNFLGLKVHFSILSSPPPDKRRLCRPKEICARFFSFTSLDFRINISSFFLHESAAFLLSTSPWLCILLSNPIHENRKEEKSIKFFLLSFVLENFEGNNFFSVDPSRGFADDALIRKIHVKPSHNLFLHPKKLFICFWTVITALTFLLINFEHFCLKISTTYT